MKEFFEDKLAFDFQATQKWIEAIEKQDCADDSEIRRQLCHILNVYHLWVSRLLGKEALSQDWDDLPFHAWEKLNFENYQLAQEFLDHYDVNERISYTNSDGDDLSKNADDILYHILQHSTHHRAVINVLLRQKGLNPVDHAFILVKK